MFDPFHVDFFFQEKQFALAGHTHTHISFLFVFDMEFVLTRDMDIETKRHQVQMELICHGIHPMEDAVVVDAVLQVFMKPVFHPSEASTHISMTMPFLESNALFAMLSRQFPLLGIEHLRGLADAAERHGVRPW
jgi:hypothetical protein